MNEEWSKGSQDVYNTEQKQNTGDTAGDTSSSSNDAQKQEDDAENVDYEVVDDDKD